MNEWMNDASRWQAKPVNPPLARPQPRPLLQAAMPPQTKEDAAIANGSNAAKAIFDRTGVVR
jgi:hypothetical protein